MHQPCQREGRRARGRCADGVYPGDLELVRAGASVGREAGNDGCAQASLLAEQLGSDDEVAELLEEAFVVCAADAGVDGFLCLVNEHVRDNQGAHVPNRPCGCGRWSHGGRGCAAAVGAGLLSSTAASTVRGARSSAGSW